MIDCGCETTEGFIKITHVASINDSFWVKEKGEAVVWNDISFYRNEFNDTISKLASEIIHKADSTSVQYFVMKSTLFAKWWTSLRVVLFYRG